MSELDSASAGAPPPPKPARRVYLELAALLLAGALCLSLLIAVSRSFAPQQRRTKFDSRALERVKRRQPDLVVIGNSMVYTRFQEQLLKELVHPTKVELVTQSASQSAIWYLTLKYSVIPARVPVRRVAIFFRDRELTLPLLRATGTFTDNVERWQPKPDPVIQDKLAPATLGPLERLALDLARLAPFDKLRSRAAAALDERVVRAMGPLAGEQDPERLRKRVNELFRVEALRDRADDAQPSWERSAPFSEVVERSFLPDMVALAKAHDIELVFVRVRKRRIAEGKPEKPGLPEYLADLHRYLARHGAGYVDLAPNSWEAARLYGSGDHIAGRSKREYTRLFVEHQRALFQFSAPGPDRSRRENQPP